MYRLKFLIHVLIGLVVLVPLTLAQTWKELKGEHFIVYFMQDDSFAKNVLDKAEGYYKNIASELGYPRYSDFWIWDKRVKIYIYQDHSSFLKATGQPQWSHGMADYRAKQITSFVWSQGFLESLLPHEIAHLIFRDFVGFKGEIPLWLDEGVAQWAEESNREKLKLIMQEFYKKDSLLSLEDMTTLDIREVKDKEKVFVRPTRTRKGNSEAIFLSGNNLVHLYYLQAVSLVGFLIEQYGSDSFASFCRELRDGKSLNDALKFTYPSAIRTIQELEEKWHMYLEKSLAS
ncbi:MAG: hypothetical protein V1893_01045 [Candidatus Omnitrophota bacterium]